MKYLAPIFIYLMIFSGCSSVDKNVNTDNYQADDADNLSELPELNEDADIYDITVKPPEQEPIPKVTINSNSNQTSNDKRVLVNQEVMSYIEQLKDEGENIEQLIFYLSKSFTLGITGNDNLPNVDIIERLLLVSDKDPVQPFVFAYDKIGTTQPDLISISNNIITINFQTGEKIVPIGFRKNLQDDCYDLYSLYIDSVLYGIQSEDETPKLYIYASIERGNQKIVTYDFKGVPIFADDDTINEYRARQQQEREVVTQAQQQTQRQDTSTQNAAQLPAQNAAQSAAQSTIPAARSTNILGAGSLKADGVIEYVKSKNLSPALNDANLRRLVNLYFSEAASEDVNHDLAVAQMLYWTNFLSDKDRVLTNNFGGLAETEEWNGRFPYGTRYDGMTEGVKAHVQHLRLYASNTLKNINTINVDPRHMYLEEFPSRITTFNALYEKWTQNTANYRQRINAILNDLYRFSDRY